MPHQDEDQDRDINVDALTVFAGIRSRIPLIGIASNFVDTITYETSYNIIIEISNNNEYFIIVMK